MRRNLGDIMTTKGASFQYEEIIDLHTESDRVTVIGIHTPTSDTPRRMAPGLFSQFKKFKYIGCDVVMVPAATLPVDPLGVSYEGGDTVIDPRDMLNPILFHGCHGNDLGDILNRIYSAGAVEGSDLSNLLHTDSADFWSLMNNDPESSGFDMDLSLLESLYYRALTDRTWQKAHIQRGFRKYGLHPRIYSLATNMQLQNAAFLGSEQFPAPAPFEGSMDVQPFNVGMNMEDNPSYPVRFFTPRTVRLGWLDTRQVVGYSPSGDMGKVSLDNIQGTLETIVSGKTIDTKLPRIFMGVILLPPAYKTEQYFRMVITHKFAFAGFRGISMSELELGMPPNYRNLNPVMSDGGSDDPVTPDDPDPPTPPEPVVYSKIRLSNDIGGGAGVYTRMQAYDSGGNVVFDYSAGSGKGIGLNIGGVNAQVMANTPVVFTISGGPAPYFALCQGSSTIFNFKTFTPEATTINSNSSLRTALETTLGGTINVWNFSGISDLKDIWKLPVEVVP